MGLNSQIIDFSNIHKVDEDLVGKRAYELGTLWKLGIPLSDGFVITTQFYKDFLRITGIDKEIARTQALVHPALSDSIEKLFQPIQRKIMQTRMPQTLTTQLHKYYRGLSGLFKEHSMNVFSSALNNKSVVFSNIKGDANLILKIKTIWSSFPEENVAVVVQKDIKTEIQGKIVTDEPTIDKNLTQVQMNELINYCKIIQKHFYFPKEIEYVLKKNKLFITRVNPFTGTVSELPKKILQYRKGQKAIVMGKSINPGIVTGKVKVWQNIHCRSEVRKGEIVVLSDLNPLIFKKIKNAKAVIIDSVSPNSLDKTLYRKYFRIPTIEGAKNSTKIFQDGNIVTVNGISGEVYSGGLVY